MKNLILTIIFTLITCAITSQWPADQKPVYILEALVIDESLPCEMQLEALKELEAAEGIEIRIRIYNAHDYIRENPDHEAEISAVPYLILRNSSGTIINQKTGYTPANLLENWINP